MSSGRRSAGISAAFSLVRRVTGPEKWAQIRLERRQDLIVYLALAAFGKRPRLGQLATELQQDIRAFFGSYKSASAEADELLYRTGNRSAVDDACRGTAVGKRLPDALYVHSSAVVRLPPLLRVYEGCGRQLTGSVEGANIIKLSRRKAQISYLVYPNFDKLAHPLLTELVVADLTRLRIRHRDLSGCEEHPNPTSEGAVRLGQTILTVQNSNG